VLDQHALADTALAHDEEDLAVGDREAHAAQHGLGPEGLVDVDEFDHPKTT